MGITKYFIFILVVLSHDPYSSRYFHENSIIHFAGTIGLLFSFLETGYITGKQFKLGIYKKKFDFLVSRYCRIYVPSIAVIVASFILMKNSLLYADGNQNIFQIIASLSLQDKIIYYTSHMLVVLHPWLFFQFDHVNHQYIFQLVANDEAQSMIKTSIAPHLWTVMADTIGMTLVALFYFSKRKMFGLIALTTFILIHLFVSWKVRASSLDTMWIIQNPFCILAYMGSGFVYGLYRNEFKLLNNYKIISALLSWLLITASILAASYLISIDLLPGFVTVMLMPALLFSCELLWPLFSFKKWDMEVRDMCSHLYFWHFLFLSVFYSYFTPSFTSCVFFLSLIVIFSIHFGPWFEVLNKKIIKQIIGKFS